MTYLLTTQSERISRLTVSPFREALVSSVICLACAERWISPQLNPKFSIASPTRADRKQSTDPRAGSKHFRRVLERVVVQISEEWL